MAQLPPAGWYQDPSGAPTKRWWTGTEWAATGPARPARRTPRALILGGIGVLIFALIASASAGVGGFISTVGLAAVVVGVVGLVRNGVRALAVRSRTIAGIVLGAGVVGLLVGGSVSGTSGPRGPEATEPRRMVGSSEVGAAPTPEVVRTVEEVTETVLFERVTVEDPSVAQGTSTVTTPGSDGVRTIRYVVTYTDGIETARRVLSDEITVAAVNEVTTIGTMAPRSFAPAPTACDPNYDPCVPIASDVDCAGGSGNGPAYVSGPVRVIGRDVYGLDSNGDGYGCE